MNPMPGKCPVCHNTMHVTRLQCGQCGTGIDGVFALGRLQALTADQVQFVETFIKCKGKIKDMENQLGISYPTVVARLNDVVRAMGFDADEVELSEVEQYEYYQAQVLNPNPGGMPTAPVAPSRPAPSVPAPIMPVSPTMPVLPRSPRLTQEQRQQVLDDLAAGKITMSEAMTKLNG